MAVGFKYDDTPQATIKEVCRFDSVYRAESGANLSQDYDGYLMPLDPLYIDKAKGIAYPCIRAKVVDVASGVRVLRKGLLSVGMIVSNGTSGGAITSIKEDDNGAIIEVEEATFKIGDVIFQVKTATDKKPLYVANYANYATTPAKENETLTYVLRAYQIREDNLFTPHLDVDKEGLTSRFEYK